MTLSNPAQNILQYESTIWSTADLLRGCGIKESEWPSYMMPFFALAMIESRLIRMFDELKAELGEDTLNEIEPDDLIELIQESVKRHFQSITQQPKYAKYADVPIYVVYSSSQDQQSATGLNDDGISEEKVLRPLATISSKKWMTSLTNSVTTLSIQFVTLRNTLPSIFLLSMESP